MAQNDRVHSLITKARGLREGSSIGMPRNGPLLDATRAPVLSCPFMSRHDVGAVFEGRYEILEG